MIKNLVPETCTSFLNVYYAFSHKLFSCSSFLHQIEQRSIWRNKLVCIRSKMWGLAGRLCFQLASSIIFIVSHVCCAACTNWHQIFDAWNLRTFLVQDSCASHLEKVGWLNDSRK